MKRRITKQNEEQIEYNNLVSKHKRAMLTWQLCNGGLLQKNALCERVNVLVRRIDAHPHYKRLMEKEAAKFGKREEQTI